MWHFSLGRELGQRLSNSFSPKQFGHGNLSFRAATWRQLSLSPETWIQVDACKIPDRQGFPVPRAACLLGSGIFLPCDLVMLPPHQGYFKLLSSVMWYFCWCESIRAKSLFCIRKKKKIKFFPCMRTLNVHTSLVGVARYIRGYFTSPLVGAMVSEERIRVSDGSPTSFTASDLGIWLSQRCLFSA